MWGATVRPQKRRKKRKGLLGGVAMTGGEEDPHPNKKNHPTGRNVEGPLVLKKENHLVLKAGTGGGGGGNYGTSVAPAQPKKRKKKRLIEEGRGRNDGTNGEEGESSNNQRREEEGFHFLTESIKRQIRSRREKGGDW